MAKIRRVVRKPRSEQSGDIFDDQLWPTYIALVVLGAFSMGVSAAYKSFSAPEWYNNALTYLILIPLVVGAFMLAIWSLDNRAFRRSMQFSAVVCAIVHLAFVVQMIETNLSVELPVVATDNRRIERRPPKPIPEYRPQQMLSAEERPQQDHEKPLETQTPEPTREPEEIVRQETPRDVAPPQQQPFPCPKSSPRPSPTSSKSRSPTKPRPRLPRLRPNSAATRSPPS
jgi:outer membrane biosynthesis protein TonB